MSNGTLLNVWEAFQISNSKDVCSYQTALFRFTLPGLGGRKPTGARLSSKEIAAALKMLASISISPDIGDRLREAQKQTFELMNTPKARQRQPRYYLSHLINWATKNQFFPSASSPEEELQYTFYPNKINYIKTTKRGKPNKFTFSFDVSDYAAEPLQPEQIQQHLQRINAELASFKKYQIQQIKVREVSANIDEKYLKLILGWLYREKGVSLAEISLSKLVPFIRLNFQMIEFDSEENPWLSKIIAEAKALENIKGEANRLVNLMEEFFGWLEHPPSPNTKKIYLDALIAYSKYVYRSETDETMALNFEDIPITNRLKVFYNKVKNGKKNNSKSSQKYLPWHEVLGVLEKLRFEAELKTVKSGKYKRKRPLSAQAISLQNFVLLGFYVLVPPSRQRVIRELELGRTLKYGIFEHGRFTPFEKMTNPTEAKYYVDLQPEDYKTGDTYLDWRSEFPNTEFPDGSKFYDYLNRWLFQGYQDANGEWHGMRELIAAQEEKTIFVREELGKAHDVISMSVRIRSIFTRWTGVPISPHDLRHLYRTYIDAPETEATEQEKKSTAHWMRHSNQTAETRYVHLDNEQKLRAGAQMAERLNKQLLNGKK